MGIVDALKPIYSVLPEVKRPERAPGLRDKLLWTTVALLIFFLLGQIYPIGVDESRIQSFLRLDILLGSQTGSLISAGIGPIVLASIFLQLAVGAKLINMDLSNPENKKNFQGLQKLLAILLSFLEGAVFAFSGYITATDPSSFFLKAIITLQLAIGSVILLYLDEVVQKYGIGSGISLFIAAGVSRAVFVGAFSFFSSGGAPSGLVPLAIYYVTQGQIASAIWSLVPILFTIIVFMIVVYVEGMRIELPLAYGRARGLGARYPIKFLYVSNIPVILASAVLLNVQLMGAFTAAPVLDNPDEKIGFLGTYVNNQPQSGVAYMLTAPPSPMLLPGGYETYLRIMFQPDEIIHILVYGLATILLCVIFGWFWIESTGMGAKDVAGQLQKSGLLIPGFRQDPRITEHILEKYIPVITVLGSIFVGLLAWFADVTGALGTGTGILLTVGILYRFYEDLAKQQLFDMYPVLKTIVR